MSDIYYIVELVQPLRDLINLIDLIVVYRTSSDQRNASFDVIDMILSSSVSAQQ